MAAQPNKVAPASAVLADLNKRYGVGAVSAPQAAAPKKDTTDYSKVQLGVKGTSSDPNKQDPISWLTDILSRPLYAVTDTVKGAIDAGAAAQHIAQKGGSVGDQYAAEFDAIKNHNPLTGFFSTDKANKSTTADLIEHGTDTAGSFDPNYKDTKNNVNPVLKGVLGFAGDVGLDPTTYIPGAQIAKGLKIGLDAAKALKTGVETGVKAAKAAKVSEKLVTDLAKDVPITPENAVASDIAKTAETAPAPVAPSVELTPAQKLTQTKQGFEKQAILAIGSPNNAAVKTALSGIKPMVREQAIKAVGATDKNPLAFQDWITAAQKELQHQIEHDPKLADLPYSKAMEKLPAIKVDGKTTPLPVALQLAKNGDVNALTAVAQLHKFGYTKKFIAQSEKGNTTSAMGRVIEPVSAPVVDAAKIAELQDTAAKDTVDAAQFSDAVANPTAPPVHEGAIGAGFATNQDWIDNEIRLANEDAVKNGLPPDQTAQDVALWMAQESDKSQTALDAAHAAAGVGANDVLNAMQAFKSGQLADQAFVEGALGAELVKNLKSYANPGQFDLAIKNLTAIMQGSVNITDMKQITGSSRFLLQRLGFEKPAEIPAIMKQLRADANVVPLPTKKNRIDTAAILAAQNVDEVAQETVDLATTAVSDFVRKNIVEPKDPIKFPFTTTVTDAKRTGEAVGEGVGRHLNEMNTMAQGDLGNSIMKRLTASVEKLMGKNTYGAAGAMGKAKIHLEALRLAERGLDEMGVPLTLGVGINNGQERILLGGSQVIDVLMGVDSNAVHIGLYNYNTAVPLTNLYDAAFAATKGGNRLDIEDALRNTLTAYGKDLPNNLANPILAKGKYMYGTKVFTGEQLVKMMADTIQKATPTLQEVVAKNAAAHEARGLAETKLMTDMQLQYLEKTYAESTGFSDLLQAVNDTGTRVAAQAKEVGALTESTYKTGEILKASIPVEDMATATVAVKIQQAADSLGIHLTPEQKLDEMKRVGNLMNQGLYETRIAEAAKLSGDTLDIGTVTQRNIATGIFAMWAPGSRVFGNKVLHNPFRFSEDMARGITMTTADMLAKIDKKFPRDVKIEAFRNLQRGVVSTNAAHKAAADAYRPILEQLFGSAKDYSLKDNSFFRNSTAVFHLNKVLQQKGLGDYLVEVSAAADAAKKSGKSIIDEAAAQWMIHDIADPSVYLNKMTGAMVQVHAHHTLAMEAMSIAKRYGGLSDVPKEGYVRLVNDKGTSILHAYFPTDKYIRKDIAQQIGVVDSLIQETLDLGGPIGSFVNNVYRPALDMFKVGMTILQPAHHVRNALSDMDLTRNAEGFTTKPIYKWAMEAIATRNQYTNFDAIAALGGIHARPKPGRTLFRGSLAKDGISPADLYANIASRGVLPNYKRLENLEEVGGTSVLAKMEEKINGTKVVSMAASIGEANSHWTRLAHAAQFVEKNINNTKQYKTMDQLWDAAAIQVKKWHPDGSDLSKFDKVMRLIIPFYSWQRKSIPLVLETFLMHPARAQVLPKASYALATSMGVNPDSLSDPFPQDQLFPSYFTEKTLGPQFKFAGKYYGLNPGFATTGTADTYLGNNPLSAVLGQVSPFIRAPFELAAGANVGTGAKINDQSDYIDSNIPIVAPISRLTGTSVTGSIASILQGKGLDPQYQIRAGNKDPATSQGTALANYLSGLSLTPMSQPNQINYAEIEKRNAAAAVKGN